MIRNDALELAKLTHVLKTLRMVANMKSLRPAGKEVARSGHGMSGHGRHMCCTCVNIASSLEASFALSAQG